MKLVRSKKVPIFWTLDRHAFNTKKFTSEFYSNVSYKYNSRSSTDSYATNNETGLMGSSL